MLQISFLGFQNWSCTTGQLLLMIWSMICFVFLCIVFILRCLRYIWISCIVFILRCLKKRIDACVKGAADTTGCEFSILKDEEFGYKNLMTNKVLAERYKKYAESLGMVIFMYFAKIYTLCRLSLSYVNKHC